MTLQLDGSKYPTVTTSVLKPFVRPNLLPKSQGYKRGFNVLEDEKQNSRPSKYRQHIRLSCKNTGCLDCDWSADGSSLLVLSPDGMRTVDTSKDPGREDRVFPNGNYISAKIDPTDSQIVAAVTAEGKLLIMKALQDGIKDLCDIDLEAMDKNMRHFTELIFSPDGNMIALSSSRNVFTLNLTKQEDKITVQVKDPIELPDKVNAMIFDATGEHLWVACGSTPGTLWRYEVPLRKNTGLRLTAHRGPAMCLACDKTKVVSGGADGLICVWDPHTAEMLWSITKPDQAVSRVSLSADGSLLAYTSGALNSDGYTGDRWFHVANVQTRQVVFGDQQKGQMCNIKWCPKTNRLAYFFEEEDSTLRSSDRYRVGVQMTLRHAHLVRVPDRM